MSRRRSKFAAEPELSLEALIPDREDMEAVAGDCEKEAECSLLNREAQAGLCAAIDKLPPEYHSGVAHQPP